MGLGGFEAGLRHKGYEMREGEIKPDEHRSSHAHDFDARVFILSGSITLVFGTDKVVYRTGGSCKVPAGIKHEEHTGPDGVSYVASRRDRVTASAPA